MSRFGADEIIYNCHRIDKGIPITLFYGIYGEEKIYTTLDCENKNVCEAEERHNWQSCPAYKKYLGENHLSQSVEG